MADCIALIVAAGSGTRVGADVPKQYLPLAGRAVLRHSAETFLRHPAIAGVGVVISAEHRARYDAATAGLQMLPPVVGGTTRQESVRNGLESLAGLQPARVLIHDAARPLLSAAIIDRAVAALDDAPAAIVAVPVADTLKREDGGRIAETVDRRGLWRAQTPQAFRYAEILAAHRSAAGAAMTDDAAVAERRAQ